jgi:hypothetical protein
VAIKFKNLQGKASKAGPDRFKYSDGLNQFRIVSPVIPQYKYWLKTTDGMDIPMDCLSFDREEEKFTNEQKDWVRHYFPDKKCSWAYASFVIDRSDGTLKLIDHKKKLFEQILATSKKLGDPTDWDKGWDIVVERIRTGPKPYNVEYHLDQITSSETKAPLTEEEKTMLEEKMPDIEEFLKVPTPEEQKKFIEERILGTTEESEDVDNEALNTLGKTGSDDL